MNVLANNQPAFLILTELLRAADPGVPRGGSQPIIWPKLSEKTA